MTKDLTKGRPMPRILSFGIPVLLGYLFQQLYSVVDTAIVGKTLGGAALAAVGSTGSINFLVVGFCCGVCAGFAIPVAQQFGAGNNQELRRYVTGGVWLSAVIALVMTAAMAVSCDGILTAMNTPGDIYQQAYAYIQTIFLGLPAYVLYNFCAGVLRSLGDSRTPVIWLVAASLTNIVLDIAPPAGLGPGTNPPAPSSARGTPAPAGSGIVTAVTAASKVSMFLCCPFDAMGCTMATYGGQNVGAAKWERLHQGVRACVTLGAVYSGIALAVLLLFSDPLTMLFLDEGSAGLLPLARQNLLVTASCYFLLALVNIFRFLIQGMGFSPLATLAGVLEMAARAGISCLVPLFGFAAACFASPMAWLMADAFLVPAYFYCYRRLTQPNTGRRKLAAAAR